MGPQRRQAKKRDHLVGRGGRSLRQVWCEPTARVAGYVFFFTDNYLGASHG